MASGEVCLREIDREEWKRMKLPQDCFHWRDFILAVFNFRSLVPR
jgi:hypothetical protein